MASRPNVSSPLLLAAALALLVQVGASGCHWLRWRALATTHVDLMEQLALDAAAALTSPGGGLEPSDIERLRYPLWRARAFANGSRKRFAEEPWLGRFDAFLVAYDQLVAHLDKARTRRLGRREHRRVLALAAAVEEAAAQVRAALEPSRRVSTSWPWPNRPGSAPSRCRSAGA